MQILEWNNLTGVHCGSSTISNKFFGVDYPENLFWYWLWIGFSIIN